MQIHPNFLLSSYHFDLPEDRIAHEALAQRDQARLLVVRTKATAKAPGHRSTNGIESYVLEHKKVADLPELLPAGAMLVVNNTEVIRARLLGHRILKDGTIGGKVEFFLIKKVSDTEHIWQGMMKSSAHIEPGFEFVIEGAVPEQSLKGVVLKRDEQLHQGVLYHARFDHDPTALNLGEVPLPPYIVARRKAVAPPIAAENEWKTYNTVYSKVPGSVAAPTAGRHFTSDLIQRLKKHQITWCEVTLHVGIGTFRPVQCPDIRDHVMHPETAIVSPEVAAQINEALQAGRPVIAVGTTSARTLEGMAIGPSSEVQGARWNGSVKVAAGERDLDLFIYPHGDEGKGGHHWKVVQGLLTNFHLPESSLLMMVSSFIGSREIALKIYEEAIRLQYRFYSYGDAMLILPE